MQNISLQQLDVAPRHPVTVRLVPTEAEPSNRNGTCIDAEFAYSPPAKCDMAWLGSVRQDCEEYYCLDCPFAHKCDVICEQEGFTYCDSIYYGFGTQLEITPATATFTPENWSIPLEVSVTGTLDNEFEDSDYSLVTITPHFLSDDCHYNGTAPAEMSATFVLQENDCASGYAGSVQTGCADVDECATNNGMCRAECANLDGSYACGLCADGTLGEVQSNGDWRRSGLLFFEYEIEYVRVNPKLPEGAEVFYQLHNDYFFMWLSSPLYSPGNELSVEGGANSTTTAGEYYTGCCDDNHALPQALLVANETIHVGWEFFANVTCKGRIERATAPPVTGQDSSCSYHQDCASCMGATSARAPATGCGWCATTQQCLDGGRFGANYPYVCIGVWEYDQCPCEDMGKSILQFSVAHDTSTNCTVNSEICPSTTLADYDGGCAKGITQGYSCDYLDLHGVDCARERYCGFCENQYGVDAAASCMTLEEQNLNTCIHGGSIDGGSRVDLSSNVDEKGTVALTVPSALGTYYMNWYSEIPCKWADAIYLKNCYRDTDGLLWTYDTNKTVAEEQPEFCWALRKSLPVNVSDALPLPEPRFYNGLSELPNLFDFTLEGSIDVLAASTLYRNCSAFCINNCYEWDGLWRFTQGVCELASVPDLGEHPVPIVYAVQVRIHPFVRSCSCCFLKMWSPQTVRICRSAESCS